MIGEGRAAGRNQSQGQGVQVGRWKSCFLWQQLFAWLSCQCICAVDSPLLPSTSMCSCTVAWSAWVKKLCCLRTDGFCSEMLFCCI